jgi:hypothetical protein
MLSKVSNEARGGEGGHVRLPEELKMKHKAGALKEIDVFKMFVPDETLKEVIATANSNNSVLLHQQRMQTKKQRVQEQKHKNARLVSSKVDFKRAKGIWKRRKEKLKNTKGYEVDGIVDEQDRTSEEGDIETWYQVKWKVCSFCKLHCVVHHLFL